MSLTLISQDVFDQLATEPGLPEIAYPNVNRPVIDTTHLRVFVLPADTVTIGLNDTKQELGLIAIQIFVRDGSGAIGALEIADQILATFPRNLQLAHLRIDKEGSVKDGMIEDGWYVTSVKIPYQAITV